MSASDIPKRFTEALNYLKRNMIIRAERAVLEGLDYRPSTLSEIKSGRQMPPAEILNALKERFRIDSEWILHGKGRMLLPETDQAAETTIIPDDDEGCLIEVPYIIKDADYAKGFSGHHAPLTETTYMLPVSYIQLRYVVIDVHDNSMRPELIDGDTVLCVDMIPEIWPALWAADLTYCLVTKDGIIYRYIADFDHKTDTFKLVTVNSQAPPEFINMKDVRKLMRVESIVEPSPKRLGRKSTVRKLTG